MPENSKLADQNGANNLPDEIAELDNGLSELQNRAILALISRPDKMGGRRASRRQSLHTLPLEARP